MYSIDHVVLAVSDLDEAGERLRRDHGLASVPGGVHPSWTRPDGAELRWRGAGLDDDSPDAWLPFFIAWDVPAELHPGRTSIHHDVDVTGIANLEIAGDRSRLRDWLGGDGDTLPLTIVDGDPGIRGLICRFVGERRSAFERAPRALGGPLTSGGDR